MTLSYCQYRCLLSTENWTHKDRVHNIPPHCPQTTVKRDICCLIFNVHIHHFKLTAMTCFTVAPPVTGSWAAARAALLFGTARVPAPELPRYQAWHLFPRYTVSPRRIFGDFRNFDIDTVMNAQYSKKAPTSECLLLVETNHLWTF